jgi:hypothetical protein
LIEEAEMSEQQDGAPDPEAIMQIEMAFLDYTCADCRQGTVEAGFVDTFVEPLVGPQSMVAGRNT